MNGGISHGKEYFVNCGTEVTFEGEVFELCSPTHSGHLSNIVNIYLYDKGIKIGVGYSEHGVEMYRFKNMNESGHYWSRMYTHQRAKEMEKYTDIVELLERAYHHFFG